MGGRSGDGRRPLRSRRSRSTPLSFAFSLVFVVGLFAFIYFQHSGSTEPDLKPGSSIASADLPKEAQSSIVMIDKGGPYPYRQDNSVFGNRERLLPARPSGYYREYTVETPGSGDRGPRRLIRGMKGETYYTSDHYASFHLVERN